MARRVSVAGGVRVDFEWASILRDCREDLGEKPFGCVGRLSVVSNGGEVPAALVSLVEKHQGRLVGLLTLRTGSREVAEDLAQDTIERACSHWEQPGTIPPRSGGSTGWR